MSNADKILELLAARHAKDVFVPECRDGPSQTAQHARMDAWAMRRSWRHPCCTAYEIKVARRDFLRDDKWRPYLACCNQFYFATVPGTIDVSELPTDAGLLITSRNVTRLYVKRRAPYRDVPIPEDLFRYILMSRAEIVGEHRSNPGTAGYWRAWLAEKREKQELGWNVGRRIQELVRERIVRAESENRRLEAEIETLAAAREIFEELGINAAWIGDTRNALRRAMADVQGRSLEYALKSVERASVEARRLLAGLGGSAADGAGVTDDGST